MTPEERAEAMRKLEASAQRGQDKAVRGRTHEEREIERRNREAKAARKAEHERVQREIAARKAALITQGITPESRSERKRRLAREATERAARRSQVPKAVSDHRVAQTVAGPGFDRNINRRRSGQAHAASRIQEETQDCATARHWE